MPDIRTEPKTLLAAGKPPKTILEYFGRVSSGDESVSIARMVSPEGWSEPGQRPEFREFTLVLHGCLVVETQGESYRVTEGQAVATEPGEWVRYSTPEPEGAEYVAICLPAFSPTSVHRDE
jgi:quercetin dioxygenase-like cupin family protein